MGAISEQGLIGILAAVIGVTAGIMLSRMARNRFGKSKTDSKPPSYASRQDARRAERERAKKDGR